MTVLKDESRYAVLAEPFGNIKAFNLLVEPEVASARANDYSYAQWILLRYVGRQLY
jgi:hypothetical protein